MGHLQDTDVEGKYGAVIDGGNPGEFIVSDFDEATLVTTIYEALGGAPASGNKVEFYDFFTKTDFDEAIAESIAAVRDKFLVIKYDRSLTVASATYEYALPSGFDFVGKLVIERSSSPSQYDLVVPDLDWELVDVSGTVYIKFLADWHLGYVGKCIEIQGAAFPTAPSTETDSNPIDDTYVINRASWWLGTRMPMGQSTSGWNAKVNEWLNAAREYEHKYARSVLASLRRVPGS
jgi:hypothetical protein